MMAYIRCSLVGDIVEGFYVDPTAVLAGNTEKDHSMYFQEPEIDIEHQHRVGNTDKDNST